MRNRRKKQAADKPMKIIATSKYIRQSPRKVRAVANLIKGLALPEAQAKLKFSPWKGARLIKKTLDSAVANAQHNYKLSQDKLSIKEIQVGPGPTLKRVKPRARGRGDTIRKRSCHIRVVLEDRD